MVLRILLGCLVLIGLAADPLAAADPKIGEPAPDFTAKDAQGKDVKLSSFRGGNVVLVFTRAHW